MSRSRPDIYWGAAGDTLSQQAARATCEDERRKLNREAAKAHRLSRKATALMKKLGVSQMPEGVWSHQI